MVAASAVCIAMWLLISAVSCAFWFLIDAIATPVHVAKLLKALGLKCSTELFVSNLLHHVFSVAVAVVVWLAEEKATITEPERSFKCMPPAVRLAELLPAVTLGYSLHEFAYAVRNGQAFSFWIHAAGATLFLCLVCHLGVAHHLSRLFVMNFSTIFLILRRLDCGPKVNTAIDLIFVVSFFLLRVVLMPYWWVLFLRYAWTSDKDVWGTCMNSGIVAVSVVGGILINSLNFYWFLHICRKIARRPQYVRTQDVADDSADALR